jgi:ATP-dependent Lhr-like helicase
MEDTDVDALFAAVRRAAPYAELSRRVFDGVLDLLRHRVRIMPNRDNASRDPFVVDLAVERARRGVGRLEPVRIEAVDASGTIKIIKLGMDTRGAVGATAAGMDLADLADERLVSQCPG